MRELSPHTRSNIGYGILGVFLNNMDEEQGVDDLIYALHTSDTETAELNASKGIGGISPTEAADLIERILNAVIYELENENNEDINAITNRDLIDEFVEFAEGGGFSEEDLPYVAEKFFKYKGGE